MDVIRKRVRNGAVLEQFFAKIYSIILLWIVIKEAGRYLYSQQTAIEKVKHLGWAPGVFSFPLRVWLKLFRLRSILINKFEDDYMAKVVDTKGKFKILQTNRDFIIRNIEGKYKQHSHFQKLNDIYKFINIINKGLLPRSKYWKEAARRLLSVEEYGQLRDKRKERYINVQKGVRL